MNKTQILIANFSSGGPKHLRLLDEQNNNIDVIRGYDLAYNEDAIKYTVVSDIITALLAYDEIIIFANNITECISYLGYDAVLLLLREHILKVIPDVGFCPILMKNGCNWQPDFIGYGIGDKDTIFNHKLGHVEYWFLQSDYKNQTNSFLYLLEDNSIDLNLNACRDLILAEDRRDIDSYFSNKTSSLCSIADGSPFICPVSLLRLHNLNSILHVASNIKSHGIKIDGAVKNVLQKKAESVLSQVVPDGTDALLTINRKKGLPNIGELYIQKVLSMDDIIKLRNSVDGKLFRKWTFEDGFDENQMCQDVMNSVSNLFGKNISQGIRILSCNLISLAGFVPGVTASALDNIVFERILKGWHPNLLLDDQLKRLIDKRIEKYEKERKLELLRKRFRGIERNDECPCGSGLKFKNCHGKGL